jgi:transcription antitermination factor NusA-like protein
MVNTLDMQGIRHLNLFERITRVQTKFYFQYNNMLIFCVPLKLIKKAVGENGENVKTISRVLRKRIKIIPSPLGLGDVEKFIKKIVEPIEVKNIEIQGNEILISANKQNKASLIGRNKRRLIELQKIINNFFGKGVRIV